MDKIDELVKERKKLVYKNRVFKNNFGSSESAKEWLDGELTWSQTTSFYKNISKIN